MQRQLHLIRRPLIPRSFRRHLVVPETKPMKAVLIKGGQSQRAEDLYIGDFDEPEPTDNEIQVEHVSIALGLLRHGTHRGHRVKAFGLNRMDVVQRHGKYPLPPMANTPQSKEILGVEFSGVVRRRGATARDYREGDEVFGLVYGGAMAQYVVVKESMVVRKPKPLTWEQAAAIPENWMTAYQAMRWVGGFQEGQNFLFHAGASGVGTAAIQLARHLGARHVFASAGSDKKIEFLRRLGCTDAINYKTDRSRWLDIVKEATENEGVHVIVDPVGQEYFSENLQALALEGRVVLLGTMSGSKVTTNIAPILFKRLRVEGTTLRSRPPQYQAKLLHEVVDIALDKILTGKDRGGFDLVVHKVFKATQIVEATLEMEEARNIGKIVCVADW